MLDTLALLLVVLTGLFFVALAALSLGFPSRAANFLEGFAGSAGAHFLEMFLRLAVGAAFIIRAPLLPFPGVFSLFGWVLVATTICLLAIPWRWHRWFAQRSVPHAVRHLKLVAVASLAMGGFVLASTACHPL